MGQVRPPAALVFDLDGTLIDSRRDLATAVNHVRASYRLDPLPHEADPVRSDRFVGMYVNDWTRGYGDTGRRPASFFSTAAGRPGSSRSGWWRSSWMRDASCLRSRNRDG